MSRHMFLSFLFLLPIFVLSRLSLDPFDTKVAECYTRITKMKNSSMSFLDMDHYDSWKDDLLQQCFDIQKCFTELTRIRTDSGRMLLARVLEADFEPTCSQVNSYPKTFSKCLYVIQSDIVSMKDPNYDVYSRKDCPLTSSQMIKISAIVQQKCGIDSFREFKDNEESVKMMPCLEGFKRIQKRILGDN